MKPQYLLAMTLAATCLTLPALSFAQGQGGNPPTPPNVTLDMRDVPIRAALEQIFNSAKVDYSIAPTVQGYVNLKVTDLSFENALKLILRSSTTPLTYSVVNNVYLVTPRVVSDTVRNPVPPVPAEPTVVLTQNHYEQIELTYADPADLAQLLNITLVPVATRWRGGGQGGSNGIIGGNNGGRSGNGGGNNGGAGRPGNGGTNGGSGGPGGR